MTETLNVPYKKKAIPAEVRRGVAAKYGASEGETVVVACHYCGLAGELNWCAPYKIKGRGWVNTNLEFDHVIPEVKGGLSTPENIVLACSHCNRSRGPGRW